MSEQVDTETTTGEAHGPVQRRASRRMLLIAAGAVIALVALAVVADVVTASPKLCGSCHAMQTRAASWAQSPHETVECVACHEPPRAFYGSPAGLAQRAKLLSRDIGWQLNGRPAKAQPVSAGGVEHFIVEDENCLRCHDPNRQATSGFRILIDHAEHAKRNGSCISCHVNTGHPRGTGSAISLMERCFTCHGTPEQPKASAKCSACHPKGYELRPASHKKTSWRSGHGRVALSAPEQCTLCHTKASCTTCHGVTMPHPKGWAKGRTGHAVYAKRDRAVCARCHTEKPDLCSMCHHKGYDPAKGTWVKQHYVKVREGGTSFCLDCHSPVFCADCHVKPPAGR